MRFRVEHLNDFVFHVLYQGSIPILNKKGIKWMKLFYHYNKNIFYDISQFFRIDELVIFFRRRKSERFYMIISFNYIIQVIFHNINISLEKMNYAG